MKELPRLNLRYGDRLEPGADLMDVALFEHTTPPFTAIFWNMSQTTRVLHSSPIYDIVGVSPNSHAIDLLHTWNQGPEADYLGLTFHFVLSTNIFESSIPYISAEDNRRLALMQLKSEMWKYYAEKRRTDEAFKKKGSTVI